LNGALVEEESKAHEWIGYAALGLVGLRLIWALTGPKYARFSAFPPSPAGAIHHLRALVAGDRTSSPVARIRFGALMVYNIWLSVIALGHNRLH